MPREAYVFAQFLRLLPRYEFQRIMHKYHGDYRPGTSNAGINWSA
jgi:hypothetical protein